ncbi:uncharacterized protein LOC133036849 [Cannabis sativa]|uniref:uncharacterized protein LOC133036849 n=1 Tax=Cannabis sativa TaxID=3483 RepID=UPI0029C9BE61|nr:uncharacterized protein LOC133036849 [Cannabis sativa]
MKILSWNARGLGNPSAFRQLRLLVKQQSPHVLFIMETKLVCNEVTRFRQALHFPNGLEVPRVELSGGLFLLWKDNVDVNLLNYNINIFDCYMKCDNGPSWHFSAFYGASETHNRIHTWKLLERCKDVAPLMPWLVIGDFNEILSNENKHGGALRCEQQMDKFRSVLDICYLYEQPFDGDPFTWIKGRHNVNAMKERLDWCFVNDQWSNTFQPILTKHLDYYKSDHRAITVEVVPLAHQQPEVKRLSRFRFEKLWLSDSAATDIIHQTWKKSLQGTAIDNFCTNIEACSSSLQQWHHHKYSNFKKKITAAHKEVELLNNQQVRTDVSMCNLKKMEDTLDELLSQEEVYWQERSRIDWLQCGDENTKCFHAYASSRKTNNTIKSLHNEDGVVVTSKHGMTDVICNFFGDLFFASGTHTEALQQVLHAIPTTVTAEMNDSLLRPFSDKEVLDALHSMSPDKSPGSDGMSAMFYQHCWDHVGTDVTDVVLGVLNEGHDMSRINNSIITLIPKIKKPKAMGDYRPISLCNVIYKLISKVIVLRFKDVLPFVISENQSAFLPNRLITDNILVAFELVHHLKHKTQGNKGFSALKLDMSKAFDRVEWDYLSAVMEKMGFAHQWISLIMRFLLSNSFSFQLNGEIVGNVWPTRGLRQESALAIKKILEIYRQASGQFLNTNKSIMSFSPNTSHDARTFFSQTLGMPICECHETYLGLPAYSSHNKKELFSNVKDRIWKLLTAWNDKLFSIGGKEVLLKAVVQSIPTYAMSCFRLPLGFCNQIESMMENFWWGSNKDGSKIHWKRWKLLSRLLKHRYFPSNTFLEAHKGHSPSLTWQGIHWGRELLLKGLRYKIGNGFHVRCGIDPWIPGHDEFKLIYFSGEPSTPVSTYIHDTMEWNLPLLHEDFAQIDIDRILTTPLSFYQSTDRLFWHHTTNGLYSVKSGFHLASSISEKHQESSSDDHKSWWKYFWALQIPPKVKIFAWKVVQNALPVATGLHKRNVIDSALCSRCKHAWESIGHALFSCKSAKAVWKGTKFLIDYHHAHSMFNGDYLIHLATTMEKMDVEEIICVMWSIWNDRNKVLHGGLPRDPISIASFALNYIEKNRSAKGLSCKKLQQEITHRNATSQSRPVHQTSSNQEFVQGPHLTAVNSQGMPTLHTMSAPSRSPCQQFRENHTELQPQTASHQHPAAAAQFPHNNSDAAGSVPRQQLLDNISWTPPAMNELKMNVDAAANFKDQTLGIGAVVRNYKGAVIAALSKRVQGCFRSDEMEAKALFHSLNWVKQYPFLIAMVETDALRVSSALNSSHKDLSCFADLIDDVRCLLSSFPRVTIIHARRQANKAAHGLARYALELDEDCRIPIVVSEHANGLFLVTFECEGDKGRIPEGQSWHFSQSVTIFAAPHNSFPITHEYLHYAILDPDKTIIGKGIGPYLRMRILLDVNFPLRRGLNLQFIKTGREIIKWLFFKYERLPDFCYFCGKLDHTRK